MSDVAGFIAAVRGGEVAAVQAALDKDPDLARSRDESGVSVVCVAVYFGRENVAQLLARARRDLDVFEASTVGDGARVRELVAADPTLTNAYSPDGFHPLGYACFFGRREVAEVLLAAGADLESPARNATQVRPLHSAVAQSDHDTALFLARRLLAAGASPNTAQQGGATPLHEAAYRGNAELVRLLLKHGADPGSRDAEGKSPIDLAREHGHDEVTAILARAS
jgi:ankyrin repeat protein